MREIKFEYGFESVNGIIKKVYHLHEIPSIKEKCDVWNVLPIAYVREFTGLRDKNGKEIFEGDVVFREENNCNGKTISTYKVVFKDGAFCLEVIKSEIFKTGAIIQCIVEVEIIGNIYENPELLK